MKKVLWMRISLDKYELPEFVSEDINEIAAKYHTTPKNILLAIDLAKKRGGKCKFCKVIIRER